MWRALASLSRQAAEQVLACWRFERAPLETVDADRFGEF